MRAYTRMCFGEFKKKNVKVKVELCLPRGLQFINQKT